MRSPWIPAVAALALVTLACNKDEPKKPSTAAITHTPATPGAPSTADKTGTPGATALPTGPVAVAAPDKLIPADASLLAHVDLQGLAASPLWAANRHLMDADPEVKKQIDALAACNMPLSGFRSLDIGVGPDGADVAAIVTGAGVGKPENIACLQDQLKGENFKLVDKNGSRVMVLENGDAHGYLVNDDTLAFVNNKWDASVRGLMVGTGTAVRDGAIKDLLAQVDQSKHVWFAGTVGPGLNALTRAIPGGLSGLQSIAGSLDLTAGLALVMSFGMENPDRARATLAQVQKQFSDVKPMAGMFGVPSAAVDRVQFDTKDTAVTMTASLNMDEINAMRAAAEKAGAVPGPANQAAGLAEQANSAPGSKASNMPTTPGNTAPSGASPTPSASGVPASDPHGGTVKAGSAQTGSAKSEPTPTR